jgi:hypothetical protein
MSLSAWAGNGWLLPVAASSPTIKSLRALIQRDLQDCQNTELSRDWCLAIAYNAVLQVALTALTAEGYRPAREGHHYRAIQSLALTLGCDRAVVAQLDAFRKKRNVADYERAGFVSDREAAELVQLAQRLAKDLDVWLAAQHPELL